MFKTLNLSQVREIMISRNISTLRMERDQIAAARKIVGNTNAREPYLSNIIRALCMFPRENTTEEWQRLEASLIVRAYRGANRAA